MLETIRDEVMSLPGVGSSVMEISHRSPAFGEIITGAVRRTRELMNVSDDYEVIFLQGGATLQNAMIPANLLTDNKQVADYVVTGSWSKKSCLDVPFYGQLNIAFDGSENDFRSLPTNDQLNLSDNSAYLFLTSNETIQGVQFPGPIDCNSPIVVDQSSDFLSRPIDVSR